MTHKWSLIAKARDLAEKHKLPAALLLVIIMAITLVTISVNLYYATGFSRYDLSRPGYEREREEISKPEPAKTYDTTNPVTRTTIDEFIVEYDERVGDLHTYGDFRDTSLSDEDLQITPSAAQ